MDRLILLWALGCTAPARPADAPAPAPAPAPVAAEPAPLPAPEPAMDDMPEGCCILQVTVAESGYVLRLWNDGHATEAWPGIAEAEKRPFETSLAYAEGRRRFAEAQRLAWAPLIAAHDGAALGPFVAEGTLLPGGNHAKSETLVFRTRSDDGVRATTIRGDLRAPASLGPLEGAWTDLQHALWGPHH